MTSIRSVRLSVDKKTWNPPKTPTFPAAFNPVNRTINLDIQSMLHRLGLLTTPVAALGMSLAEHWAWIRYFYAFTSSTADKTLTLAPEYANLDPHQKTILSDDIVVAVPVHWLMDTLNIKEMPVDGIYFVKRMAHLLDKPIRRTNKRGPLKTPDFIMRDIYGKWHVLECKGTQSSISARNKQLSHNTKKGANGAVVQKTMIELRPEISGQRLGSGLFIGVQGGKERSHIRVVDPEYAPLIDISRNEEGLLEDAVIRSVVSKSLILSGMISAGSAFGSPEGFLEFFDDVSPMRFRPPSDTGRFAVRELEARQELSKVRSSETALINNEQYCILSRNIELPRPLYFGGRMISNFIIKNYISHTLLDAIEESRFKDEPIEGGSSEWGEMVGGVSFVRHGGATEISIGKIFKTKLIAMEGDKEAVPIDQ